jgi:hypothetical protein
MSIATVSSLRGGRDGHAYAIKTFSADSSGIPVQWFAFDGLPLRRGEAEGQRPHDRLHVG